MRLQSISLLSSAPSGSSTRFGGLNPFPYHVITILFHGLSAVLLWRVLLKLDVPGAWLGALLWAIHPVQVESVAWISEMKNTESGVFYLLTILVFVGWIKNEPANGDDRPTGMYFFALFWALLAMLSKPSTVVLPAIIGLCWWWKGRRFGLRQVVLLLRFAALSAIVSCCAIWEQTSYSWARGKIWDQTWPQRFTVAGKDVWFYLEKLAWPHPLMFVYPPLGSSDGQASQLDAPILCFLAATLILWLNRNGRWKPLFSRLRLFCLSDLSGPGFL